MSKKAYPLRIPEGLLELAEIKTKEERLDKATALRQWLYIGAEEYVLRLLSAGRLTISQAAKLLELSIYDIQQLAEEHGVEIGSTTAQYRKARQTASRLL